MDNINLDSIINEIFDGGGKGPGSSIKSFTSKTGAQTWFGGSPQYRTSSTMPADFIMQKDEENATHPAPKILPFHLDFINDYLVNAFISLQQTSQQLKLAKNDLNIQNNQASLHTINKSINTINKMTKLVKQIAEKLDTIFL